MKNQLIKIFLLLYAIVFSALLTSCETTGKIRPEEKYDIGKCKNCKGEFKIICPTCSGMKAIPCGQCKGLRGKRRNCSNCNHGKIKTFFGREKDCDKCKGTGIITEYCSKCSGKGKVSCEQCGGTGKIECTECAPKPPAPQKCSPQ